MAQNRAGRYIRNVVSVHHGKRSVEEDVFHFSTDGQIKLGKIAASTIE